MIKFTARLTKEEKSKLDILSNELNISRNEIIKLLINNNLDELKADIKVKKNMIEEFKKLSFQLQKIGVVLNQINKNFYEKKNVKIEEIDKGIDELWQYLKVLKE